MSISVAENFASPTEGRALLDGSWQQSVCLQNRAMAYGDGLFETLPVFCGEPLWLTEHLARLRRDVGRLGLALDVAALRAELDILMTKAPGAAILKITVYRKQHSGRGYTPATCDSHRLLQLLPPAPSSRHLWGRGVAAILCQQTLAQQADLAGIKHLNRLEQVLAAAELQRRNAIEGLMLDTSGLLVEGTRSNVFLVCDEVLCTPYLDRCGVAGVMRAKLIERAESLGVVVREKRLQCADLVAASEVFICNSVFGIWPLTAVDCLEKQIGPLTRLLQDCFKTEFHV